MGIRISLRYVWTFHLGALGIVCGCSLSTTKFEPPTVLLDCFEQGDWDRDALFQVCQGPRRNEKLKGLFEGWGRRSEEFDSAVWSFLGESNQPSVCSMDEEIANFFLARIREDPSLLRQLFWTSRWGAAKSLAEMGITDPGHTEPVLVAEAREMYPLECPRYEKMCRLTWLASMLDRPELVTNVTWNTLDEHWRETVVWFKANAPYFYFDAEQGIYVLDPVAVKENRPVSEPRQRSTANPPTTRFPPRPYPARKNVTGSSRVE